MTLRRDCRIIPGVKRVLRPLLLAGASVALWMWSSTTRGAQVDTAAFRAVNAGHGELPDRIFAGATELGSLYASGAAAAALTMFGHRRTATRAIAAAGLTWLAGQGLKRAVERPRPYEADPSGTRRMIGRPPASSWPSSHPAVFTTFTTVAGRELALSRGARLALGGLALAVAASRVYLGVHYPSDVASGLLLGRAVADAASNDRS